jgi:hypothetical protein
MGRLLTREPGAFTHWSGGMSTVLDRLAKAETHAAWRPVSLCVASEAAGQPQLFAQMVGSTIDWQVQPGLTLQLLRDTESNLRQAGRRIEVLGAYTASGEDRFIVEDVANANGPDWKLLLDQSQSDFENSIKTEAPLSFRPWSVTGYGSPSAPRYASLWLKAAH